jgi:uncharacterized protein YegP (UPF0339 family)
MKFEIEKSKNGTFTARIKTKGRITFSNSGLNTKQAAYKKIAGLYKAILNEIGVACIVKKRRNENAIHVFSKSGVHEFKVAVKEIEC